MEFHGTVPGVVPNLTVIRRIVRLLPSLTVLLVGVIAPLPAGQRGAPTTSMGIEKAPTEPATFAVIGGTLCLIGLKLRRRQD